MTTSLIAFGANLGNRVETFERACQQLSAHEEITVVARSQHHQTSPIGGPAGQEDFLNAAILIDTSLSAQQLLVRLQAIETQLGRRRQQRWDRRPIDLDLLLYDTLTLEDDQLEVPHPHMAFRRFVLEPAVEIAPTLVHPTSGWSIQQLHAHLDDAKNYLALVGPAGSGKTDVARVVCEQLGGYPALTSTFRPIHDKPEVAEEQLIKQRLEELETVSQRLESTTGDKATLRFAISDFWLKQSFAYLQEQLDPPTQERFLAAWKPTVSQALQPKLRILLEPEGNSTRLSELAQQPLQGPLLRLTDCRPQAVVEEVSAAILSMQ